MSLLFELWDGTSWKRVFRVEPGEAPGTIGNTAGEQREVLFFVTNETESVISRSTTDDDIEIGDVRAVSGADLEPVVTLLDGEVYELLVATANMVGPQLCRFRHYAGKTHTAPSGSQVRSEQWPRRASASSSNSRQRTA